MTDGWRFTSSMPAIMRSLSSFFEVTRLWRTDRANLKPSIESEGKLEASRRSSVEPGCCFSRYVRRMIIEDQLDRGAGRISGVRAAQLFFGKTINEIALTHQYP